MCGESILDIVSVQASDVSGDESERRALGAVVGSVARMQGSHADLLAGKARALEPFSQGAVLSALGHSAVV